MPRLYFEGLLTQTGWLDQAALDVDAFGIITDVKSGISAPEGTEVFGYGLPSAVNVHSHAFQRAAVGLTEWAPEHANMAASLVSDFWSWRDIMYRFAAAMTPDSLKIIARMAYLDMLKNGYSAVGEFHYLHNAHKDQSLAMSEAIIDAAEHTGIALTHLPVLYQQSGFGEQPPIGEQQAFIHTTGDFKRLLTVLGGHLRGHNTLGVAIHSLRAVGLDAMRDVLEFLPDMHCVHIHIAEQVGEVEACVKWSGMRPVEWLLDNMDVDKRWCLIHATHVNDAESDGIIASGANVGLCPTTEANLGDGVFPAQKFIAGGGAFSIGSDSHVSTDPREELRLLEYGQRLISNKRNVLVPPKGGHVGEHLWMKAAIGGAQALGQNIGDIATGKRADLIVIDPKAPSMAAARYGQIADSLVFSGGPSPVTHVMVGGKFVIKNNRHTHEDSIIGDYSDLLQKFSEVLETKVLGTEVLGFVS